MQDAPPQAVQVPDRASDGNISKIHQKKGGDIIKRTGKPAEGYIRGIRNKIPCPAKDVCRPVHTGTAGSGIGQERRKNDQA